jgi:hypothetical protein
MRIKHRGQILPDESLSHQPLGLAATLRGHEFGKSRFSPD